MKTKLVKLEDLQPTDELRKETVSFLETLGDEEIISKTGFAQAWLINGKLYISDGNNRSGIMAAKGINEITVEYKEESEDCFGIIKILLFRAKKLRKMGIHNPYDLWDNYQKRQKA
ncbi:hypothetical protein COV15_01160 [Candidatus Woesearchaeota archaeon CG10_big_fil_rev_8_21_14_0_10_34_12]|nr:MAG: hypothetical protein COV15_01160 [Candidatus Woesearchaeota archaeon CG10_big_fil_rev_8_21_14_0_10_34_12]